MYCHKHLFAFAIVLYVLKKLVIVFVGGCIFNIRNPQNETAIKLSSLLRRNLREFGRGRDGPGGGKTQNNCH